MTVFGKLALGLLIFVAATMIFGLGSMWVAGIWTFITAQPYLAYFSPFSDTWTYFAFACLFLLIGLPVVGLVLWLGRVIFKFKSPSWLGVGMGVTWVISFLSVVIMTGFGIRSFRQSGTVTKNIDLTAMSGDTLRVNYADAAGGGLHDFEFDFDEDDFKIDGDQIHIHGPLDIRVSKAAGNQFECVQNITARGASHLEAVENAGSTQFTPQLAGNTLLIPTHYNMQSGRKWRVHTVKLDLAIPVGKYVVFGKGVNNRARNIDAYADREGNYYIDEYPERVFQMTSKGLVCTDCPSFGSSEYRSNRNYENFVVEGQFDLEIRKADNFRLDFEGPEELKNKISIIRSGDQLTLSTDEANLQGKIKVLVETPVFTTLHADESGNIVIRGFDEHRSSISAKGRSKIKALYDSNNLTINLDGPQCTVELIGEGQDLDIDLSNGANLESGSFKVDHAKIRALDGSKARIFARQHADVKADASSNVKVDGDADVNKEE